MIKREDRYIDEKVIKLVDREKEKTMMSEGGGPPQPLDKKVNNNTNNHGNHNTVNNQSNFSSHSYHQYPHNLYNQYIWL